MVLRSVNASSVPTRARPGHAGIVPGLHDDAHQESLTATCLPTSSNICDPPMRQAFSLMVNRVLHTDIAMSELMGTHIHRHDLGEARGARRCPRRRLRRAPVRIRVHEKIDRDLPLGPVGPEREASAQAKTATDRTVRQRAKR